MNGCTIVWKRDIIRKKKQKRIYMQTYFTLLEEAAEQGQTAFQVKHFIRALGARSAVFASRTERLVAVAEKRET